MLFNFLKMQLISSKTIQDLEFNQVLQSVSEFCVTELGKEYALNIQPVSNKELLMNSLKQTSEYTSSFTNNNIFPSHYFESIHQEIKFLGIEDSFLEASSFKKIAHLVQTTNELLLFVKKFEEYYPSIYKLSCHLQSNKIILQLIEQVLDKYGEIKDNASVDLSNIRRAIHLVRGKINQSFSQALASYSSAGYLDDIKESIIDNRRVLAVVAMHRKKVNGSVLGQSKTGSIIFIAPESTYRFSRELSDLEFEQREEIIKILKKLTKDVSVYSEDLIQFQEFLTQMDVIYAKAKYAEVIQGILPQISSEKKLSFIDAYHPLLWQSNKLKGKKTHPQTLFFDESHRIIVISGPNAGGKSITLKTVGLLQLMLQSGLLIPVHHRSETFFFDTILTDIGDNQSIENHLSTYSYRLKNMNYFLRKCNENTLFLIDEFGTGSDPELGGALAEVFLEEFYQRQAFGIITTHYTNLKILANELPFAVNANMLFDRHSLEPMYQLSLGQAGSSFTFEVAQKNGIPYRLINRAKKKVESDKIRFDKTIANLQKERSELEKTSQSLKKEQTKAREQGLKMEHINTRIQEKLERYQEFYDFNQRLVYLGQRLEDLSEKYFYNKDKKTLIGELLKTVEVENSKRKKITLKEKKETKEAKKELTQEVAQQIEAIRLEKKKQKTEEIKQKPTTNFILKVGDRVRMQDGKAVGSIDSIEKNIATVNYGWFISKVALEKLEMVERKK